MITKNSYKIISKDYKKKVRSEELDHVFIERFLTIFDSKQEILDLGCGTGQLTNEIKNKHKLKVIGIDNSKEMIKIAKKSYPDILFKEMDLRNLKFSKNRFDGVFANYSLIHIFDYEILNALKGINKILKKKGYLYISLQEPIKPADIDGFYPVVYRKDVKMFINLVRENEIRRYLGASGFKILKVSRRKPEKKTEFPFNKLFIIAKKRD